MQYLQGLNLEILFHKRFVPQVVFWANIVHAYSIVHQQITFGLSVIQKGMIGISFLETFVVYVNW